ncbi:MAG: MarR family transcriptional regulator [Clostridiales bacterium]|nr:MarR family transcriptional regulator [Clostridiales bacterium]
MEMYKEHILASHLRACGHFLYYQTGGKTGQRRILLTLLKNEGLTQKELQDILEISSGALSEILQKMEDASLIEREKSPDDKRQVRLSLTSEGKSTALQAKENYIRVLQQMFECLDEGEKAKLDEILEKLVEHLDFLKADPFFEAETGEISESCRGEGE